MATCPMSIMEAKITIPNDELLSVVLDIQVDARCVRANEVLSNTKEHISSVDKIRRILDKLFARMASIEGDETASFVRSDRTWDADSEIRYVIAHMLEHATPASYCTWAICESDIHHRWSNRGGNLVDQTATITWSEPAPLVLDDDTISIP